MGHASVSWNRNSLLLPKTLCHWPHLRHSKPRRLMLVTKEMCVWNLSQLRVIHHKTLFSFHFLPWRKMLDKPREAKSPQGLPYGLLSDWFFLHLIALSYLSPNLWFRPMSCHRPLVPSPRVQLESCAFSVVTVHITTTLCNTHLPLPCLKNAHPSPESPHKCLLLCEVLASFHGGSGHSLPGATIMHTGSFILAILMVSEVCLT